MTTLTLNIPSKEKDISIFIAAKLFEAGKLSLGQSAKLCGMNKVDFADILYKYNVSLINYSAEDAVNDAQRIRYFKYYFASIQLFISS